MPLPGSQRCTGGVRKPTLHRNAFPRAPASQAEPLNREVSIERACSPCNKDGVPLCFDGGSEPLTGYRYGIDPNRTASQAVTDVSQAGDSAADHSITLSVMGTKFRAG